MTAKPPWHPYAVLALALFLPGAGHVAAGQPQRGLGFAFLHCCSRFFPGTRQRLTTHSSGAQLAELFVWALSIPDAYRIARLNYENWRKETSGNSYC